MSHKVLLSALISIFMVAGMAGGFGCAAAAVGAGAAGGIAYTDRGAKGTIKGDVNTVNQQAKQAFQKMGIQITGTEMKKSGKERDLNGKSTKADVSVNMVTAGPNTTQVEVVAQESTLKWNKDYAKQVLDEIVNQS